MARRLAVVLLAACLLVGGCAGESPRLSTIGGLSRLQVRCAAPWAAALQFGSCPSPPCKDLAGGASSGRAAGAVNAAAAAIKFRRPAGRRGRAGFCECGLKQGRFASKPAARRLLPAAAAAPFLQLAAAARGCCLGCIHCGQCSRHLPPGRPTRCHRHCRRRCAQVVEILTVCQEQAPGAVSMLEAIDKSFQDMANSMWDVSDLIEVFYQRTCGRRAPAQRRHVPPSPAAPVARCLPADQVERRPAVPVRHDRDGGCLVAA